ncbi:putative non-specific serine/threonine protein kinase [Rosa chinensis]|uniref:Putative non-specific serine/threonine protein kinase n=1 Tax=Rosa chinensis TaxID=74649 RepID=A0A2P6Q7U5_ROSCH|nr:putative non-specific serine/threonine protein kinase [Rosa chinensis]
MLQGITRCHIQRELYSCSTLFLQMSLIFKVTKWVPPFELHTIDINNCQLGPGFPIWLQPQTQISCVRLPSTGISGSIPEEWLLKISSQLYCMDLSHNQIQGKLPFQLQFPTLDDMNLSYNQLEGPLPHWFTSATSLDLRSNLFSGPIPSNVDQLFPELQDLYLSENHLNGSIPPSICNIHRLLVLSLRSNRLSGEFPQAWSAWQ